MENKLSGESELVPDDAYTLYVTEPEGYTMQRFSCADAEVLRNKKEGVLRIVELKSAKGRAVQWNVEYAHSKGR